MQWVFERTSVFARASPAEIGTTQTTSDGNFLSSTGNVTGLQLSIRVLGLAYMREAVGGLMQQGFQDELGSADEPFAGYENLWELRVPLHPPCERTSPRSTASASPSPLSSSSSTSPSTRPIACRSSVSTSCYRPSTPRSTSSPRNMVRHRNATNERPKRGG